MLLLRNKYYFIMTETFQNFTMVILELFLKPNTFFLQWHKHMNVEWWDVINLSLLFSIIVFLNQVTISKLVLLKSKSIHFHCEIIFFKAHKEFLRFSVFLWYTLKWVHNKMVY